MSVTNPRVQPKIMWNTPVAGDRASGSMAGNLESDWIFCEEQTSAHNLAWPATGSPVGVFSVELSMDGTNVDQTLTAADFSPALSAPTGTAGRFAFVIKSPIPYRKIKYTRTSGTGTLTGLSNTKRA